MKTVAAFVMKSSFLWLCVWCWAQTPQVVLEPKEFNCSIGHFDKHRPERWQLYLDIIHADDSKQRKWMSDHDSAKSAMKACGNALDAQNKDWKQQLKASKGKQK